jgi:glycosyltransferase involved in cell wall biosynthesis
VVVREWPGYVAQKNYAASLATNDWILSLDADERVTPALAGEIQRLLAAGPGGVGVSDSARELASRPVGAYH